ncbi:hypothetical protein BTI_3469 [Burkholderia thailandensis MSMB121]|uniref:Uncharacterized protein n=2 Tax=Burkholderia humptydooensis TaxID=430531 RepID=A0A7U4STR2_9BURK|nr:MULTISPECIES: hypothetical protein [Burkholderia]AGK48677.1 hypothetical protein BTI_3469 [Burkholderia thailandensis MSMB121]ATF35135.1 hypothetical protein CO709_18135 [Burkholderia thailandensis]AJY41808.1 hypothetical protein BW21_3619 [Burkholderia sp. 2002721687]ALX44012.1 hypothetical protein AQ610_17380 [Burkholderia humptydooensis]EIP89613.1 hypothetical protein A33K_13194 [Burkholderia humptydooensis MSMB43]
MSIPNKPISNAFERPEDSQAAAGRLRVSAPSGVAPVITPSITPANAPPEFANPHAAVADMRRQARAKAQQMVVDARLALLESLHALHTAGKTDAVSTVAVPAPIKRGMR